MTRLISLIIVFLLVACDPSGVSVYNTAGGRVGRVDVTNEDHATVFDLGGSTAGLVSTDRVTKSDGTRVGRVSEDDRIYNVSGTRIGRVSEGSNCLNASGIKVGSIASDIDDEAAGGACLLLLLLQ
jgi:hypothetical protein